MRTVWRLNGECALRAHEYSEVTETLEVIERERRWRLPLALVTGTANGLGYELTAGLIERGWRVAGVDFNAAKQQELAEKWGEKYLPLVGDISDEEFVNSAVAKAHELGHIDLLINNAGQPSFKAPTAYVGADMDKTLKGLKGMMLFSVATLKADEEKNLKIANVMSTAATRGNANESVYCAAKWGEKGYTESLKAAYKGTSVLVVGIYPGGIDTPFYKESHDYVSVEKQHTFMNAHDLAEVLLFNLVNEANLTVSDIRIDRNYV